MSESNMSLRDQAIDIWSAGVRAVASERLVRNAIERDGDRLRVAGHEFSVSSLDRILVVGTGKAGAGMAAAVEEALGPDLLPVVTGFVNVPEDCTRPLQRITLHGARPAGVNEPTRAGVEGASAILDLVSGMTDRDLCLVLISGGGSALLPCPIPGISLDDKQQVTRLLMHGGATINELNAVRKQLSSIKGGGLARASSAGTMISLIISDVIDDPLDVIASGPTVDDSSTPAEALEILNRIVPDKSAIPPSVYDVLEHAASASQHKEPIDQTRVFNHIIGNNDVAVRAAEERAEELGFEVRMPAVNDGIAREVGSWLGMICMNFRMTEDDPICVISGGEPTVELVPTERARKGGRNQELVLAAAKELHSAAEATGNNILSEGIVILSGGTDGEDGPTDAAGAVVDQDVLKQMEKLNLDTDSFLAINNSYPFFEQTGGLLKTGPTHTNVMDLRVALVIPDGSQLHQP